MYKPVLPFLETMITYACNLSCNGCTNYSDYHTKGYVPWAVGKKWIESWLYKVQLPDFGLIGGEPMLHPEVKQWIYGCRELMPDSQIRFTTNAVNFVDRDELLDWLIDIGNCVLKFTIHQDTPNIRSAINDVFSRYEWTATVEHGISRWLGPNGVRFQLNYPKRFVKSFQGQYGNMRPHHNDPAEAFKICVQQKCPLLYEGKIYKCSSVALLPRVMHDWRQPVDHSWSPYINDYEPLTIDSSRIKIDEFISNFGQAFYTCAMCPTEKDTDSMIDHATSVLTKKAWIKLHRT